MAENWQETAQLYEQLFQKPKMSEKLLTKPPFRYLHDIFTATMAKTGFGEGLFQGEELNSKGFEDKDSKVAWLVKLIALVQMMIGEEIDVKPSLVLAGQAADKTNIFLQAMFQAATCGVDSSPYVQEVLGGGGDNEADEAAQQAEEEARRQQEEAEAAER